MQTVSPLDRPSIVLFGIRCAFTYGVSTHMLGADARIAGVVLPGPPGLDWPLPASLPPDAPAVPTSSVVIAVGNLRSEASVDAISRLNPDAIVVACYPVRIPARIANIPRLGALNVHPSLLPAWRGPDPLFWTLRQGNGLAGVSVHALTNELDAGPIFAQQHVEYADGTTEADLERVLAREGAILALDVVNRLARGDCVARGQDPSAATYAPQAMEADFTIDTQRSARSAFNFVRGVQGREYPVLVRCECELLRIDEAIAWQRRETLEPEEPIHGAEYIHFDEGVLVARVTRCEG